MRSAPLVVALAALLAGCGGESTPKIQQATPVASGPSLSEQATAGRVVFLEKASPACGMCHTLRNAATVGMIGHNLDELKPDRQRIIDAVTHGVGAMPSQDAVLTPEEIEAVAAYVSEVTGR